MTVLMTNIIVIASLQVLTCTCHIYIQVPVSHETWHIEGLCFNLFKASDDWAGNVLVRR